MFALLFLAAEVVAGGGHVRFETPDHGAVHVWRPRGYDRSTAGIVVYVHGYFTDVDKAWTEHALAEQFAASRQNALFIVPEAPSGKAQDVFWKDLGALLDAVEKNAHVTRPDGPLIILGHSGAYRTLFEWLPFHRVDQMILLDALYAYEEEFKAFVASDRGHAANKLVIVTKETSRHRDTLLASLPLAARVPEIPSSIFRISRDARNHQVIELTSQYEHMDLVTSKVVIPMLLRMTPLQRLR